MRKLKLQMQLSLDGFVAGAKGEMDWLVWNWDDELKKYVNDMTEPVDCILLGRKLADGFIPTWKAMLSKPETADSFAQKMVDTHKVIFSKTLKKSAWENTELADGDITEEIPRFKNKKGGEIIVYGGGNFVSNLIKHGLIDEYNFFINPVAIGNGMTIFTTIENKRNLKLVTSKSFECGITLLRYQSV